MVGFNMSKDRTQVRVRVHRRWTSGFGPLPEVTGASLRSNDHHAVMTECCTAALLASLLTEHPVTREPYLHTVGLHEMVQSARGAVASKRILWHCCADNFPDPATQAHYQLVEQVLSLGAQMYRWPVSASSVNAIILEDAVANAGFEARYARVRIGLELGFRKTQYKRPASTPSSSKTSSPMPASRPAELGLGPCLVFT